MNDVQETTAVLESLTKPELTYIQALKDLHGGTGMTSNPFVIPSEKYESNLIFLLTIRGIIEINLDDNKIMCTFAEECLSIVEGI